MLYTPKFRQGRKNLLSQIRRKNAVPREMSLDAPFHSNSNDRLMNIGSGNGPLMITSKEQTEKAQ